MPTFTWLAKNRFGQPVVREISADSAEQARAQLAAEGCTDMALQENEVMTTVTGAMGKPVIFGNELNVSAEARLKRRNKPPQTFWRAYLGVIYLVPFSCCVVAIFSASEIYAGNNLTALTAVAALFFYLTAVVCIKLPSITHRKLLKALDWHRWDEALKLVNRLRLINRLHFVKVPETALIRYRAKALAGLGNLPQALKEYAVCENQPGCPSWLYKTMVASIYDSAKMPDKALDMVKQSLAEKQRPSVYIGLATRLLRCKAPIAEVNAALVEAEKGTLVEDLERPTILLCHGMVAYLENDWPRAEKGFRASLEILERTRNLPSRDGHINRTKARLCCALAKQSDLKSAKEYFTAAKNYLVATQNTELLEDCKRLLGER